VCLAQALTAGDDEEPWPTLRHEMARVDGQYVAPVAKFVQRRERNAQIFAAVRGEEADHILDQHRLRASFAHLAQHAHELPEEARMFADQPATIPGQREIGAGERGGRQFDIRDFRAADRAHIFQMEMLPGELSSIELLFERADIVRPHDREARRFQTEADQPDPREELGNAR